ncbi:aminotransferase class IV [Confluentibacter sediminis]|uniref:aminotransferase class IV n=1 Tax=Confluentibacter sediminis TaxID=2219045 RepID=UPI000DACE5F6|nr:aminotransferase class IV [Confluentibacter sediminis]
MINFHGTILQETTKLSIYNRGFAYGDALFETIKVLKNNILFWEDHYFRLMASMRIMRMDIPMNFTMEFLEAEILKILEATNLQNTSARVKLVVYRNEGGLYLPDSHAIHFIITAKSLENDWYSFKDDLYEVDLFKDYFIAPGLLSTLKTNNKALNVIGSIYAKENKLQNCLLLNTEKQVVEALNGNIFLVKGNTIKTPPILDGCLKGVMRKQLIDIIASVSDYTFIEASISPFELQQADELFITNVIVGIQPITKYRKKSFTKEVSSLLLDRLNEKIKMN